MATSTVPEPEDTLPALSKLCEKCSVLSFNDAELGDEKDGVFERKNIWNLELHYNQRDTLPDLPVLEASASAGCAFCAALREATLGLKLGGISEVSYDLDFQWGNLKNGFDNTGIYLLEVIVNEHNIDPQALGHQIFFNVDSEDQTCRDWLRLLPSPKAHALFRSNVDAVKAALSYCEHECGCDPLRTLGFSPTRLLDLEAWESSHSIRLVETSRLTSASATRYAALSYCWGPKNEAALQLRTTTETLGSHLNRINADLLTPVIRDAVEVTRALSLRYLWIDALCIIQENHQDWTRESERMDLVYANANCTICALASSTCLKSFVDRRSPVVVKFSSAIRPDVVGQFNLRHLPGSEIALYRTPLENELLAGAWNSRGWTYQEECLSARKVLFGYSRMFYSCANREWTEPSIYQSTAEYNLFPRMLQKYQKNGDLKHLYYSWFLLLESYTERHLTIPGDVLPAISGLAKRLAQVTGDKYLAGLWRSDLVRQLLWGSESDHYATLPEFLDTLLCNEHTNYVYGCPTWSCVWRAGSSLYGGASYDYFITGNIDFRPEARILDVCAIPEDPVLNPWGRIRSAHLKIEAKFIDIEDLLSRRMFLDSSWLVIGTDDDTHKVYCDLDFAPTSLQELQGHKLVMVLLASNNHGYIPKDVTDRGSRNGQSENSSAQTLNSPPAVDGFANTGDNEVDMKHDIEDSGTISQEYQDAEKVCSASSESNREITGDVGLKDAATNSNTSSTTHEESEINEEEEEKEEEEGVEELARAAYGHVLYQLSDARYVRVGYFSSDLSHNGFAIFKDSPSQVFTII